MEQDKSIPSTEPARATTQDVLGTGFGQSNVPSQWERAYRLLNQARRFILRQRQELLTTATEQDNQLLRNPADLATDEFDRDWALSMASSDQETLYDIEQALNRIKNGTYGICEISGQPIEPERLEAIPWTRFSAETERTLEAQGQIHLARLGQAQHVQKESLEGTN